MKSLLFFALVTCQCVVAGAESPRSTLEIAKSYSDGGGYNRQWKGSGSPDAIVYSGTTILAQHDGGTYCCGYTFAVAMQAATERRLLAGKTAAEVKAFQKQWYGAVEETREKQSPQAMENLGIGREILDFEEARPGDFVQLWRTNKSGHSVVFLDWVRDEGEIIGIRYRSSQGSTDGIGNLTEYFSDAKGKQGRVDRERTYLGRMNGE